MEWLKDLNIFEFRLIYEHTGRRRFVLFTEAVKDARKRVQPLFLNNISGKLRECFDVSTRFQKILKV